MILLLLAACTRTPDAEDTAAADLDGDGHAIPADCDDENPDVHPAAVETCNLVDDDCDGVVDDAADLPIWYGDADEDGFGGTLRVAACTAPAGFVAVDGDCDDADATSFPGAEESCNETIDSNCDGSVGYADADGDGTPACDDCNDTDAAMSPDQPELCDPDDRDEDCDGAADDADTSVSAASKTRWYVDTDSDSYGSSASTVDSCESPAGFVANADDCDDLDADDHPGAPETIGNDDDEDCDGGELCYRDGDRDGYRSTTSTTLASADTDCADAGEANAAVDATDCDDTNATVSPVATESCNLVDDDCDGDIDEGLTTTWYADADGDGSGDSSSSTEACSVPEGYAARSGDCDDAEPLAAPTLAEDCGDGIDNDCAGDLGECDLDASYSARTADHRLTGTDSSDGFGIAIALGDFDGDGTGDLSIGMKGYSSPERSAGAAAVWYGPFGASGIATDSADAVVTGYASSTMLGGVLAAGDHDGDGADDLVANAYRFSSTSGAAGAGWLVYGGSRLTSGEVDATSGVASFTGVVEGDNLAYSAGAGGDLDGDGTEELVLGAPTNGGAGPLAGAAYLYYGSATRRSGSTSADAADATVQGVAANAWLGASVSFVRDMDGDGLDELLLGTNTAETAGAAYLFLGATTPLTGTTSASTADATYRGRTSSADNAGAGVYGLTDVTGDGYGDAGVYGSGYDSGTGALWVFGGGASLSTIAVATLYGSAVSDAFGAAANSPGDLDGDGTNDLLVSAAGDERADPAEGASSLWYGPVSGSLAASTADVVFLSATDNGYFGRGLPARAGDVTGDGTPDIVIGDYGSDLFDRNAGAAYLWAGLGGE
jgi:hypothetical protein